MNAYTLQTRPLNPHFGVEVLDVDLSEVTGEHLYRAIRDAFETHSLLLFREQNVSADDHMRLASLFGPLENRDIEGAAAGKPFQISQVSNVTTDGAVTDEMDLHTLHLKANQLWHTDSTFLPVPALSNILISKVVTSTGGETELASTRAAWRDLPDTLKNQIRDAAIWHKYSHSRARISEELAALPMFNLWPDQLWRAIWTNPVNGKEALYLASHAFKIEGVPEDKGAALIDELIAFCTQPEYVYSHTWAVGDVLIWDERATMHRGTPWPYGEPRTLSSICSSVTVQDGLDGMRV